MAQQLGKSQRGSHAAPAVRAGRILALDLLRRPFGRIAVIAVVTAIPLLYGTSQMQHTLSRDHLDVFFEFFTSPLILVLPVVAVLVGARSLFSELGNRYIANTRSRVSVRHYLAGKALAGSLVAFCGFALVAFAAFVAAFWLWPALGDANVDPSAYYLTPDAALADAIGRTTFGQLLAISDLAFGLGYSAWFGICGATYALLANLLLVLAPNRAVAVGMPAALYLAATVIAALLGVPNLGLVYSAVPFGLTQVPILVAVTPTLVVLAATVAAFCVALRWAPRLRSLS